jgi:hypothetical protein
MPGTLTQAELDDFYAQLRNMQERMAVAKNQVKLGSSDPKQACAYYASEAAYDSLSATISAMNTMRFSGAFPHYSFEAYYIPEKRPK